MAKSGKSKKIGNDSTPVAPKDIKGDVTIENELSPKDAAAPRSSRKRTGDFNDFEKDEAVLHDGTTEDAGASPTQPEKKSKTTTAAGKKTKHIKDDPNSVPTEKTHPGGDRVEAEPAEESTTQRKTSRKTAGKSKATNDEVPIVVVGKDSTIEAAEPSKGKNEKPSKTRRPSKEKKEKPSKTDGHPVVTEKTHPGGDMVETEPAEALSAQEKTGKKPGRKSKAAKEAQKPTAMEKDVATEEAEPPKDKEAPTKKGKVNATEKAAQKGKSKPDSDKAKDHSNAEKVPSQAQAFHKVTAPESTKEPTTAGPKSKSKKSKKTPNAEPEADAATGKAKASKPDKIPESIDDNDEEAHKNTGKGKAKATKSDKAAKSKGADEDDPLQAPEEETAGPPDQAMDEAPFKSLLKRERAKIPSVKASANAAAEASKASGKAAKALNAKEPKSASKDKDATHSDTPAEVSKSEESKGKKRKEASDAKVDSAPSGKKQKKSRKSALEAATSAVGDLVNSGMEAAAQGVSAVKDLASGLGNNSLAEDITAVAGDAAEEKSKKAKAKKGDAKKAVKADKAKGKEKPVEEEATANVSDVEDSDEDEDYEEGDQTMALIKGFESQDEDDGPSMGEGFKEGQTVPDLPAKKEVEKQLKAVKEDSDEPGVIYVGRIPHGFYETQMRAYFGQFGHISRLRLSRNRTTGNSKHYAFIEFASSAVAKIVADTMDNYLMFGHILKCKVVPPGDVHENLWKGANKRFKKVPWSKMEGKKMERKVGREEWGKRVENERKRRVKKKEALKSIGYEFEPPKLKGPEDVPVREGGEKAMEGGAATTEEKTIVTTDGGDGTMVISEEVKTTKVKKSGGGEKRKAAAAAAEEKTGEDGGPLAEVVKKAKKAKKSVA
ncbi:MAG: hypothetical protein LQ337_004813 [Flavoplaca oasis]|nr:MAG: hypothetical protein LQ337_004813 [Flavoplaca oasis]